MRLARRKRTCDGGHQKSHTQENAQKTRYSRRVRSELKVSTVMSEHDDKITKAYSRRVRSSRLFGKNRTQGEYTDNYYQAVAGKAPAVVAFATAPGSGLPLQHHGGQIGERSTSVRRTAMRSQCVRMLDRCVRMLRAGNRLLLAGARLTAHSMSAHEATSKPLRKAFPEGFRKGLRQPRRPALPDWAAPR